MNRNISVSIQEELYPYVQKKTNISRYINELVKQDIQMQQKKPIVKAVIDELLQSEEFFAAINERMNRGIKPMAPPPAALARSETSKPFVPRSPDSIAGYACCSAQKPCKHWAFDGVEGVWKNELTGGIREVV
jgi:hypothetical protein